MGGAPGQSVVPIVEDARRSPWRQPRRFAPWHGNADGPSREDGPSAKEQLKGEPILICGVSIVQAVGDGSAPPRRRPGLAEAAHGCRASALGSQQVGYAR